MPNDSDIKQQVQHQFTQNAAKYITSPHATGSDLDLLLNWLQPQPTWHVLDIATGGGHVAKKLSSHCHTVVATDLTQGMLEVATRFLHDSGCRNIIPILADAERLPFLDQTFDVVTCRIAAHHFPNPQQFLQEAARVLKPGGRFAFVDNVTPEQSDLDVFHNTFERMRDESHLRCHTIAQWKSWAAARGLQVEQEQESRKFMAFPAWVRRMARDEEQAASVEAFMLQAPPEAQQYFAVAIEDDQVKSFEIDEWRVLFRKDA